LDVRLSVVVMKLLGIVCAVVGVALLVYGNQIDADSIKDGSHPYMLWLCAGVFVVVGFVMFYRKWSERDQI
jgi:drug/metabolite transporter (DMT)-like permease